MSNDSEMMTLKRVGRVHFVCPAAQIWPELLRAEFEPLDGQTLQARCVDGLDCWVLRTYYEFRKAGYDVSLGSQLDPLCVNVTGLREFGRRQRDVKSFIVTPRLDGHHPHLANFVIYQNGLMDAAQDNGVVPMWIQPNIVPRDPHRGVKFERLVFKGAIRNLDKAYVSNGFREALSTLGVTFEIDAIDASSRVQSWGDYKNADAVLAIRNLTSYDAKFKPASKLVNAWWAEVPALLGPEPAFQKERRSDLDYIEVQSPDNVLKAVTMLKSDPMRYTAMVQNGRLRRTGFSTQTVLEIWKELFEGQIAAAFHRWQAKPYLAKVLQYGVGMAGEPIGKRVHQRRAISGARILDS